MDEKTRYLLVTGLLVVVAVAAAVMFSGDTETAFLDGRVHVSFNATEINTTVAAKLTYWASPFDVEQEVSATMIGGMTTYTITPYGHAMADAARDWISRILPAACAAVMLTGALMRRYV